MNDNLVNTISLVIGDWSGDGHDKRETIIILSNLNNKDINKAYKKGSEKLGFDFCNDVCRDYEDHEISKDKLDLLIANGLKIKDIAFDDYDLKEFEKDGTLRLWTEPFAEIYLFIVKLGNPDFEYTFLEGKSDPSIHIGGYGLYE
jgi:hypothetical protein